MASVPARNGLILHPGEASGESFQTGAGRGAWQPAGASSSFSITLQEENTPIIASLDRARDALSMAIGRRGPPAILHSDQGTTYSAADYRKLLAGYPRIQQSMSRKGDCWDNAPMESFFHTLKTELVMHCDYKTRDQARASLFDYMEVFYNRQRRHSTLNYETPLAFEAMQIA